MKRLMYIPDTVSYASAIREKCLDCCAGSSQEVMKCDLIHCPLFPYRFGCSPHTALKRYKEDVKIVKSPTQE